MKSKDRAFYNVEFDGQPLEVDAETALSLIVEYQIYLAFKEPTDGYSDVPKVAQHINEEGNTAVITVISSLSTHLQFPLYYTKSHLRGLQMALNMKHITNVLFVPENIAQFLLYAYYVNSVGDFDRGMTVMLVDVGNSATTVSVFRCEKVSLAFLLHSRTE